MSGNMENNFYTGSYDNKKCDARIETFQDWPFYESNSSFDGMSNTSFSGLNPPNDVVNEFEDEPPLLEELGIDPDRIIEKTLTVLNPFRSNGQADDPNYLVQDADLAGPLIFCIALGTCLVLAGGCNFGYVYGIAVIGCVSMYALLNLMAAYPQYITFASVTSVLGYCLLPMVILCALGIFFPLQTIYGIVLTITAIMWCSSAAARLLATLTMDYEQKILFAYSCCLLYSAFALLAMF